MDLISLPSTTDDAILDHLSPAQLYKYARTCRSAHYTVSAYIRRRFQLHTLLARYFSADEVLAFRRLQYNTGMVISGSTALQFFDRTVYAEADLDLFVEHGLREPVAVWLVHVGYTYVPHKASAFPTLDEALLSEDVEIDRTGINVSYAEHSHHEYSAGVMVLTFEKRAPHRKVQIITSQFSPITKVLRFHSTCVMNIITHNKAYSFFPRATFEAPRRSLKVLPRGYRTAALKALEKYDARGWAVINEITRADFDGPNAAFWNGPRRVGDARCWTMRILPDIGLPDDFIENNAWSTQYTVDMQAKMSFYSLYSRTHLTASYIILPDDRLVTWIAEAMRDIADQWDPEMNIQYDEAYGSVIQRYLDMYH
ncbi:hypothetical protein HYPSUDRAFT_46484 [Hypholoma sublateritium FD-334 SS-4]|uniref:F-box domain-containing protein n=1 Tax=Hypholoma sublateritium (strain FD-334 SS-4) TaxID=945553 RepID=A0A0D2NEB5_HYPSF|nr:hypothetical protein HYPSUDRAFT_46484 [Hypholoma sublateritium FD-334 SS-4]